MVLGNIRVTSSAIHLVVNSLAWTALTTATTDVCGAGLTHLHAERASTRSSRWLVGHREAAAVCVHVGISSRAVCVVDF